MPKPLLHRFRHPDQQAELARLKRLTGLDFQAVPQSLLPQTADVAADSDQRVAMIGFAVTEAPTRWK
ncbi:MAG: hypothetical protein ACOY33_07235 [Pseudomonadota bacterium]